MTVKQQLKLLLEHEYESEDGDLYKIGLLPGMTDVEIQIMRAELPNKYMPAEIKELLLFARGFVFYGLDEVRFDLSRFSLSKKLKITNFFPFSIVLASDGFGNYWILDIDSNGNWGAVFYLCYDPCVIVKHSESLKEFIWQIDEFGKKRKNSILDMIHEKDVVDIWDMNRGIEEKGKNDLYLTMENIDLPEKLLVADLRDKPIRSGFSWKKLSKSNNIVRPTDEHFWFAEKVDKPSFFSFLFGRKK